MNSNATVRVAELARKGFVAAHEDDEQIIMVKPASVNHVLHLILSVLTIGFWIPVWVILAIASRDKQEVVYK